MCAASGACAKCQTLIQAPVPAAVIDKGLPTASLMAHVVVSKYIDHQPLFRLEAIMARSGVSVPRSTQARVGRRH
jgi:transposase